MTQYSNLKVKLSNLQLNKLNSATKNGAGLVLSISSNMIGDDETNFPYKFLFKLKIFVRFLLANNELISSYQKLNYLR